MVCSLFVLTSCYLMLAIEFASHKKFLFILGSLSPQRHSVGLDHHLHSISWDEVGGISHDDFQMGGADALSRGGVLNTEATHNWSSHYSNHNLYAQEGLLPSANSCNH